MAAVRRTDIRVWLNALGTVTPRNLVSVHAKVDGTLLRVNFREGQMVKTGELLAEIDPRPFQVQLDQAKGQLVREPPCWTTPGSIWRATRSCWARTLSRDSRSKPRGPGAAVPGHGRIRRSQVDNADLQLEYTRLTAPASGRMGLRQVDVGNKVHASDTNGLVMIAQTQPISVVFAVPEGRCRLP